MSEATRQWLKQVITQYANQDRVFRDVDTALIAYSTLLPKMDSFTHDNGQTQSLLCLHGTVPISYRGVTYNIPVSFWIPTGYPRNPPLCFVTPTANMLVRGGRFVDLSGKIYHPMLATWNTKPDDSNLTQLLITLQGVFTNEPPVYSKPAGAISQPQQQPPSYSSATSQNRFTQLPTTPPNQTPARPMQISQPSYVVSGTHSMHPSRTVFGGAPSSGVAGYSSSPPNRVLGSTPPAIPAKPPAANSNSSSPTQSTSSIQANNNNTPPPPIPNKPVSPPPSLYSSSNTVNSAPVIPPKPMSPALATHGGASMGSAYPSIPGGRKSSINSSQLYGSSPPTGASQRPQFSQMPPNSNYITAQGVTSSTTAGYRPITGSPNQTASGLSSTANIPGYGSSGPYRPDSQGQPQLPLQLQSVGSTGSLSTTELPPPIPSRPQQASSNSNNQASPANPNLAKAASLRNTLRERLQRGENELKSRFVMEVEKCQAVTRQLNENQSRLREMIRRLNDDAVKVFQNREILEGKNAELAGLIAKIRGEPEVKVDDIVVCAASGPYQQLLETVAEERALEDTIYQLGRALNAEQLELGLYLKHTRVLARELFFKRALIKKIRAVIAALLSGKTIKE